MSSSRDDNAGEAGDDVEHDVEAGECDDVEHDIEAGGYIEHDGERLISPLLDQLQVAIKSPHYLLVQTTKEPFL